MYNLKLIFEAVIQAIVGCLIVYLIGYFASGEIDPWNWHEMGRLFAAVFWAMVIVANIIIIRSDWE